MDLDRLSKGEKIAGSLRDPALHLHVLRLVRRRGLRRGGFSGSVDGGGGNAWDALDFIPIVLLIAIVAAWRSPRSRLSESDLEPPVSVHAVITVLGGLSFLLILFRIIDTPTFASFGGVSVGWLGQVRHLPRPDRGGGDGLRRLRGDAGRRTSFGDAADRLSGGAAAAGEGRRPPPPRPPTATTSAGGAPPPPPPQRNRLHLPLRRHRPHPPQGI